MRDTPETFERWFTLAFCFPALAPLRVAVENERAPIGVDIYCRKRAWHRLNLQQGIATAVDESQFTIRAEAKRLLWNLLPPCGSTCDCPRIPPAAGGEE